MMDIVPPDQKRPRLGSAPSPWPNTPDAHNPRQLPPPPPAAFQQHPPPFSRPEPQQHPLDDRRRQPSHPEHAQYELDHHRRPSSGPTPLAYPHHPPPPPPYNGQRDPMVKRDPSDEPPPPQQYRPPSTGSGGEHNVSASQHPENRGRYLPPFEHPPVGSPFRTSSYPPPPQSPVAVGDSYNPYGPPGSQVPRQDLYPSVSYPSAASLNSQRKKAQRAAQACDSCRTLKAKCDEGRPSCSSCKEKGIECHYRDPPPKQQDKATADVLEAILLFKSEVQADMSFIKNDMSLMKNDMSMLKNEVQTLKMHQLQGTVIPGSQAHAEPTLKQELSEHSSHVPNFVSRPSISSDSHAPTSNESPYSMHTTPGRARAVERTEPQIEVEDDDEAGDPVQPGQPSIPVNHTTGAARLLLEESIKEMTLTLAGNEKIRGEKYPMIQEERRGLIRLFGRGEGLDRPPGYEKDPMTDHMSEGTPSETSSDVSSPAGEEWGQLGGLTPPANEHYIRGCIDERGMPRFDPHQVWRLVQSYKDNINIMHPILIPKRLDALTDSFLKSIPDGQLKPRQVTSLVASSGPVSAGFVGSSYNNPESPGQKRKRSSANDYVDPVGITDTTKPGHPYRSISTALVLLVLALGEICENKGKIPDVLPEKEGDSFSSGSPIIRNGLPPSPLHGSPSLSTPVGLQSPQEGDRSQRSRRSSMDGPGAPGRSGLRRKNLDVIPGLAYFALATDIIGNQVGGNSLQHVHVNILAGLYHGQLARVLESHAYIHQACRSLQVILRPKLDRFKRLKAKNEMVPAKDNPLVFAFWTCLQLESDIVAELPCPHSGILTYEEDMPGPNLQAASDTDGFAPLVIESYAAQLFLRKHLNQLHNMFYKPENDSQFPSMFAGKDPKHFRTVEAAEQSLNQIQIFAPNMQWKDADEPAETILGARLRAKYYGAQVITYRHFVLKILRHSATKSTKSQQGFWEDGFREDGFKPGIPLPDMNELATSIGDVDPKVLQYAKNAINALISSTRAFHGLGEPGERRLIVTNVWGTAHAQWGNVLTLIAAYRDPILTSLIERELLRELLYKTLSFLKLVAQPSSALAIDYRILEHCARYAKLIPDNPAPEHQVPYSGGSFSSHTSGGGDVMMAGH